MGLTFWLTVCVDYIISKLTLLFWNQFSIVSKVKSFQVCLCTYGCSLSICTYPFLCPPVRHLKLSRLVCTMVHSLSDSQGKCLCYYLVLPQTNAKYLRLILQEFHWHVQDSLWNQNTQRIFTEVKGSAMKCMQITSPSQGNLQLGDFRIVTNSSDVHHQQWQASTFVLCRVASIDTQTAVSLKIIK